MLAPLASGLLLPAAAHASPHASLSVALHPDRLGARGALTVSFGLSDPDGEAGVPPPLRALTIRLPAGLGVDLRGVATCRAAALRRRGAAGCASGARVGAGHATVEVHAGSQTIREAVRLTAFRGPSRGGRPTLELLGQGSTPLEQRSVSEGMLRPDTSPYGSRLALSVPPIPTLGLEPDASFVSFSLTVGTGASGAAIVVPRRCPAAGFPFAARLGFAGGKTTAASVGVPCP
jgi:hypothetical protein